MEKHYDFKRIEKKMQELWEKEQIYRFDPASEKEMYSIDTPPPTVSGSLHIGHIFSYTQAEMIARFQRMQGKNVFYPFGFDDNGLPTERLVEKEEGIRAKDLPRSEFIKKCNETTEKYETQFRELWKSLGFSVDWSLQYRTIDPMVQRISQKSFLHLWKEGKAYVKESPVLWCTECQTSIAQAELETVEKPSYFHDLIFRVGEEELKIATTRPELLYGCVALFINPEDERYERYIGKKALVPLYNYGIPILSDEKVSMEKGTGIVMCATYGDGTDMEWVEEYQLPYRRVFEANGTINPEVPFIGGMKILEGRKRIIEELEAAGLLTGTKEIKHMVGVHERCGKEIEILPSKQWYIDILSEKQRFLDAGEEIKWYPASMKTRYRLWVENLKWDWCISRQRYFGVPIPVWYCTACGKPHLPKEEELPINPMEKAYDGKCACGNSEFTPETSVFDTWATSSVTPQINRRWEEPGDRSEKMTPMSMRTQAHEIIRTWAFYTIVKSLYHTGEIPWKELMVCGFVLAKKGEKISKSKNNSELSPGNLISNHSADVLRYWAANSKLGTDTFFSTEELAISKRFITKLWNAAKFSFSHLEDFKESSEYQTEKELLPIDQWIMERGKEAMKKATDFLKEYEIGSARHEIDEFFWKDFCDYYLEIVKERLYQPEKHGEKERRSGQYALYHTLLRILKLYAVYVPHITEYLYQCFFLEKEGRRSLSEHLWENGEENTKTEYLRFGETIKSLIGEVRKQKTEQGLSMRAEIERLEIPVDQEKSEAEKAEVLSWFRRTEGDLKACCNAKEIIYLD